MAQKNKNLRRRNIDKASSARKDEGDKHEDPMNPKTTHFEFMGPYVGPIGMYTLLPAFVWCYTFFNNSKGWPYIDENISWDYIINAVKSSWDPSVFLTYCAYYAMLVLFYFILPGERKEGTVLRNGKKLIYPMNGLLSLLVTIAIAITIQIVKPYGYDLTWICDHMVQLCTSTIIFSSALAVYLYVSSFKKGALLALGGNSGIAPYDFFIGRELNPRIFGLDLKFFNELRPGLTMWLLINLAYVCKALASVDNDFVLLFQNFPGLLMVFAFEGYYVLDSVLYEPAILTTMDIIQDGFGFMLSFGDLTLVPMMYSLQARYLVNVGYKAPTGLLIFTVALAMAGMYIFRSSNKQKADFKANPKDPRFKDMKTIPTHTSTRLLAGGWWGVARHVNYLGDWFMSVAWSLPCGFGTILPYFYPLYFAVLLIHRERRDDDKCQKKYGKAWDEYKREVPYRIIPYIY